jgi:polygalacturonase
MQSTTARLLFIVTCLAGVFAAPTALPQVASAPYYNVKAFGAIGDGTNVDSPAINKAIDAAVAAGGGTVFVPAGTYLSGSIHLKSHIHLYLDSGAVILGAPQELNQYDPAEPFEGHAYQDAGHTYFHNSLIWGENLTDVAITGQGMINGGGLARDSNVAPPTTANKSICLKLCRNVLLRDITIFHGGWFAVLATGCDNMTVDNVTIDTDRDGIDLDCCRNTMVSNCRINSPRDDALVPKSSFALGKPVITENLTIVNCQVSAYREGTLLDGTMQGGGGTGRIKLGTEANGGFRNITVANCTFRACHGLALEEVDGGIMENITIHNLAMMDVAGYPIYITLGRRNRGPDITEPSRARNILISDITATGVGRASGIQIAGLPGHNIENLRLENIRLVFNGGGTKDEAAHIPPELGDRYPEPRGTMPAYGVFARHVTDLELANIHVSFEKEDLRPAMECLDVSGLEIDNFKAQLADGVPAAVFENVAGLVVRNSPVLDGITPTNTTNAPAK